MSRKKKSAQEFRALIAEAGMSQRVAAEALGVSLRCIEQWVSADGRYPPPPMAFLAMRWVLQSVRASARVEGAAQ
jgi:DNA-binding transcriptional regulator YiaG